MTEKICPICGKVIEKDLLRNKNRKYCSIECRNKAYTKSDEPKIYYSCEWCGASLPKDSTEKYCSEECKKRATKYKTPKNRGRKKKVLSLAEFNALARANGLSYGQYDEKIRRENYAKKM